MMITTDKPDDKRKPLILVMSTESTTSRQELSAPRHPPASTRGRLPTGRPAELRSVVTC